MNKNNVALLQKAGYKYILGVLIKSESTGIKQWILSLEKKDKVYHEYKWQNEERFIVCYSEKRAKKDAYNRDRGIARLREAYKSGYITKQQVNKRGYNKFLKISNDTEITISEGKITKDRKWDGMKGYITNTNLDAELIIDQYHGLWVVERTFRISKGTSDMRLISFISRKEESRLISVFVSLHIKYIKSWNVSLLSII